MNADYEFLATLDEGADFVLCRGRRTRTGAPVLLKRARRDPPSAADRAALQRQATLLAGLDRTGALSPRLVERPAPPMLVLEDPGGELLSRRLAAGPLGIDAALSVGLQLAAALADLHRGGLLHHGLCPAAVFYREADGRCWLIDLGDLGNLGDLGAAGADSAPARLVYRSPEQAGRMECQPDARSDLYSLGILLYELLTGAPPFRTDDALAQIHWHIAGVPRPPAQVDPAIPEPLSAVVLKLLAKSPDERYQSAAGVQQDLATCARDWAARGAIAAFPLGRRDRGERLVVPSRLYGREREVHRLLQAFEQVCAGRGQPTLLLVEGYSGIGKTALIQQLVRPIVRQKGYFLSGKFDQVVRGVPFGALIQAFRGLVRQLLTESESRLAAWRETLAAALGANGGVLAEVIPEIEYIVGPQPAPVALPAVEAQNRFQRVLQNFVAALARPEHPLVIFLDDLQWADAATLGLLEPLLTGGEITSLMLMGAYRDNEFDASPRLAPTLAALANAGAALQRVPLGPLALADLVPLVADTLHASAGHAAPLARLVHEKTGGNPFFVMQFLRLLEREGHLRFDDERGCWTYRIEAIADAPLADNVVDLMTRSIRRLAPRSQYTLTLAACIGNRFDAATLALVSEQPVEAAEADLRQALAEGLIVQARHGDRVDHAFLHDRVQQAAYALIPAERRAMVHLTVGRLLRARATPEQLEGSLFDVVQHLNLGRRLIQDAGERREVAALNLAAGRRAKSSTAHEAAAELFRAGVELLDETAWREDTPLAFALQLEAAEGEYLCGRFEAAHAAMAALLGRALGPIDRARVLCLRSVAYENMGCYAEALACTREGLALFGVLLPDGEAAQAAALEREIAAIDAGRGGREIAALITLPTMEDASMRMVMSMLTGIWSCAYLIGQATLARLISATMVRLSLAHGNVEESAYGYVTHAITVGPLRGEYRDAYEYGRLALAVNTRFADARRRAKVYQQFHAHVNLWCEPLGSCMAYAREACRAGLDSGDFLYAAYAAGTEPWSAIVATQDLAQFVRDYAPSVALIERLKNPAFADAVRVILNWARALQGLTAAPLSLTDASFDEAAYVERYRDQPFFACIHAVARLQVCTLLGEPAEAADAARHAATLVGHMPGTVWPVIHEFWHAIALAGAVEPGDAEGRAAVLLALREAQALFAARAVHCAENFQSQALLLGAEIARLEGRDGEALASCDEAVEFAAARPLLVYQALAHELAARLQLQRGRGHLAALQLEQARRAYGRWGAQAKVQALERQYPMLQPVDADTPAAATATAAEAVHAPAAPSAVEAADGLDLFSVLKAAQAIAAEVEVDALLARLMRIALENAGAERGALLIESDTEPRVYAFDATRESPAAAASDGLPEGIVHFVRRTGEAVVLADAGADEQHGADPYILRERPRSVLCAPVLRQGRAVGVLYLENRHASGVFTAQRLRTMGILATQAAISLDNARLKAALEAENASLRRDLIANVSHDLRTPLVSMRGYLELLQARDGTLDAAERRQYLGIAVRQSEHLATLIDDLFELAKLDFKGMTLQRERFAFDELAADVVQKFQLEAAGRQIELRAEASAPLPFVDADLSLMERVLDNLIGNALRHTPPGGRVRLRVGREGEGIAVEVADTGRGIPPGELPFIFDRFYRGADGRRADAGGAGLGLAISKRILELHGSEIRAESDGVGGSRFCFSLAPAN